MVVDMVLWLAAIVVFVVLEAMTYQIVSIWFALGAIGGLIAAALDARFTVQMTVFVVLSVLFLMCLRPVSRKLIKPRTEKTNVESLIGKDVLVTAPIDNLQGKGEGKVNGMVWTIRSADNSSLPQGATAVVERVEGVKLIVREKESN
jgi:membrane protein implicated in regulation of membrane protease activity